MNAHLLLTRCALICRAHAAELLAASKAALENAEALEEILCNGTEDEVLEAVQLSIGDQDPEEPC